MKTFLNLMAMDLSDSAAAVRIFLFDFCLYKSGIVQSFISTQR